MVQKCSITNTALSNI